MLTNDTPSAERVKWLLDDLLFIELQVTNLKTDVQYIMRLIESAQKEIYRIQEEASCRN